MEYRTFGRTGWQVSAVGFGAWAIGGGWGRVEDDEAMTTLHAAVESGINLFDTADVYGDGRSERFLARLLRQYPEIHVVTKAGRRLDPHTAEGYTAHNMEAFVDRSLANLETESLDLVQLHCPPTEVYYRPEVFEALDSLKQLGKIQHYGVSVEKVEEALKAIEFPGVESVQIIFNMFRQRPSERFFEEARQRKVAILARVPLASGLLTGKMTFATTFTQDDHREFNRYGQAFDVGETFSGVDYETGLEAVEALRALKPQRITMAQFALQWILSFPEITTAIPGAKSPRQVTDNAAAADLGALPPAMIKSVLEIYESRIRPLVHQRW